VTELVIVGGLTIDRFADGSTAPGGTVIHAGHAAAAEGVRPSFLTIAGDEPEAEAGLDQLAGMGELARRFSPATTTFGHADHAGARVLTLLCRSAPIAPPFPPGTADCALLAPIADELPASVIEPLTAALQPRLTVLLIQGWLRRLAVGSVVEPLTLDEIDRATWATFGRADAVVVSTEDLAESHGSPFAQAALLRHRIGNGPLLVLTLGAQGHLLDDPAADRVVASVPRRVVSGVPMVGAGDTFGATLAIHLSRGAAAAAAVAAATDRVIATLEARRS
jgi:sugar/nucleoside kinase (ribokinase family)